MVIARACVVAIVRACTMARVHACTMAMVKGCTMAIVHTMAFEHACTRIIVHVSCPIGLMFGKMEGGWSRGRSTPGKQRGLGSARLPNREKMVRGRS